MKLSIVATLYQSSAYINEFHRRITAVACKLVDDDYEIIFVNDGSPDDSLDCAISIHESDKCVKVVDLSRNFGHHKAILTGLSYAKGDYVFSIDVDLEEEPELLAEFWRAAHLDENSNVDLIYGVQDKRKGGWFERVTGNYYYKVFNFLSGVKIPPNCLIAKIMTLKYKNALVKHKDVSVFLGGLCVITGFIQKPLICKKKHKGTTTYNFTRKTSLAINSITSFSSRPLYYISFIGLSLSFFSLNYIIYLFIIKLFFGVQAEGWTSIVVSIYMIGGMILFSVGVVGIYISKVFDEVKNRPYVVVNNKWGNL